MEEWISVTPVQIIVDIQIKSALSCIKKFEHIIILMYV
jgi:hypothetical protein